QVVVSAVTADLVREALSPVLGLRDLGLHQLKDVDGAERVWQLVHPRLRSDFPPLLSVPTTLHNLPNQLSSFVGRERAVAELDGLLATARLLTLTGPGGIGKTRLALRVALDLLADYPDGVWLVRLDALADSALVAGAVANVLRVREQPGRVLQEVLANALSARHLLLVLDSCEHLLPACAELADALLQASPRLQIVATSRERLGVPGEVVWQVPSLGLPASESAPAADELSTYEAVRLFADRAAAARPGFAVTNLNADSVAQVCRRLDGLPLALELAAARMNALSVEQLAQRLDDRFRLLTGPTSRAARVASGTLSGSRTALLRQQALRATIDWSYDLLSEPERVLLRRLAVFAGEWTLEAAEAVCAGEETVFDQVCSLVDKSLVRVEANPTGRYRLLETIREYALERLEASGEAEALRRRHTEYFLALVEQAAPELRGAGQLVWFKRLEAEYENVRAALLWTLERPDADLALRLGGALWYFWWIRSHSSEGRQLLERVLAISTGATLARATVLNATGYLASALDELDQASALHALALAISRELGDRPGVAMSLRCLGRVALLQGEYARADELLHEALALLRELGDRWGIGLALNNLANLSLLEGAAESAGGCIANPWPCAARSAMP
ncbi:MAG TPA: tetratricopeptide repeat protein, partial [Chloroflexota bacterium]|nr:tetratricopeptide repeat protein [Chloroflexota bacterium]